MTTGEGIAEPHRCADTTALRFRIDGLQHRVKEITETVTVATERVVKAAKRAVDTAMKAVADRGPDPDWDREDDDIRRLAGIMERLANRPNQINGDGEDSGNRRLLAWILTVTSLLAVGGITGGIVMYGEVASLRATVTQWQISSDRRQDQTERRLDRLENRP